MRGAPDNLRYNLVSPLAMDAKFVPIFTFATHSWVELKASRNVTCFEIQSKCRIHSPVIVGILTCNKLIYIQFKSPEFEYFELFTYAMTPKLRENDDFRSTSARQMKFCSRIRLSFHLMRSGKWASWMYITLLRSRTLSEITCRHCPTARGAINTFLHTKRGVIDLLHHVHLKINIG
jgi:hypothetical protein